jgi:hypothetical protein
MATKRRNATKAKKPSRSSDHLSKQLMLVSVKYIAEQVVQAKRKNNGRVPYRYTAKLLKKKVEKHFLRCP